MNKKINTIFFIAGIIILAFLISDFGFDKIYRNLEKIGLWFSVIVILWGVVYAFNTFSWWFIVNAGKEKISYMHLFFITVSGFAINYITPFVNLGGEPYRILTLKNHVDTSKSVSSTIIYTMLHQLSHFFFWILSIVILFILVKMAWVAKLFFVLTAFVLLIMMFLFFYWQKKGIIASILLFLKKLPFKKYHYEKLLNKEEVLIQIDEQIKEFYSAKKKFFYGAFLVEFLGRVIASLEYYIILGAIGFEPSMMDAFLIYAGSSLIMNLMFFIPMNLGIREGGLFIVLEGLKYSNGVGILLGVITRIREFIWIGIGLLLMHFNKRRVTRQELLNYSLGDIND
ncbi:MAG: lysylphosphatidylglycerol synthase transmembrane domain-containing protein [Ignavibacteria bacterium]|jgi:uncharacterized protein (TIRG00374 family)